MIVVGLMVNLAAAYLKPKADRFLERHFESRRIASKRRRWKLARRINELLNDPTEVSILLHRSSQFRSFWLTFLSLAVFYSVAADLVPSPRTFFLIAAAGFLILGMIGFTIWARQESVILEYRSAKIRSASDDSTLETVTFRDVDSERPVDLSPTTLGDL